MKSTFAGVVERRSLQEAFELLWHVASIKSDNDLALVIASFVSTLSSLVSWNHKDSSRPRLSYLYSPTSPYIADETHS